MAYTHLTMNELGWIETYYDIGYKPYKIAKKLGRSNQPIYNIKNRVADGWIPDVIIGRGEIDLGCSMRLSTDGLKIASCLM